MVTTPGRSQQQEFRAQLGDGMATWFAGRAEVQRMGGVQPGKIAGRTGHDTGSHFGVAPGEISAGVGAPWRGPGYKDDGADHPIGGSGRWQLRIMAKTAASAGAACRMHCWQNGKEEEEETNRYDAYLKGRCHPVGQARGEHREGKWRMGTGKAQTKKLRLVQMYQQSRFCWRYGGNHASLFCDHGLPFRASHSMLLLVSLMTRFDLLLLLLLLLLFLLLLHRMRLSVV
jgi:hypothetical protein